jgi:hypothetical protein
VNPQARRSTIWSRDAFIAAAATSGVQAPGFAAGLETMVSLGYIPAASSLTQIPFGWEVSDTGGQPTTFSMSRFDVSLQN